jgi:DNA-binding HxlR family transcriptional regulator
MEAGVKKALFGNMVTSKKPGGGPKTRAASPEPYNVAASPEPYNVYAQNCPTRVVLDRLADKWTVLILRRLSDGPVRFNGLRREIEGVSQKVLSQTLKAIERDGLIARKAFATVPVTVEYSITPLGRTLAATVDALARWAETNIENVLAAQRSYDTERRASAGARALRA